MEGGSIIIRSGFSDADSTTFNRVGVGGDVVFVQLIVSGHGDIFNHLEGVGGFSAHHFFTDGPVHKVVSRGGVGFEGGVGVGFVAAGTSRSTALNGIGHDSHIEGVLCEVGDQVSVAGHGEGVGRVGAQDRFAFAPVEECVLGSGGGGQDDLVTVLVSFFVETGDGTGFGRIHGGGDDEGLLCEVSGHFHIAFNGEGEFLAIVDFITDGPVHEVVSGVGSGKDGNVVAEVERSLTKGDFSGTAFFGIHVDVDSVSGRSEGGHQGHIFGDGEGVVGLGADHFAVLGPADEVEMIGGSGDHGDGGAFVEVADAGLEAFAAHFTSAFLSNLEGHGKGHRRDEGEGTIDGHVSGRHVEVVFSKDLGGYIVGDVVVLVENEAVIGRVLKGDGGAGQCIFGAGGDGAVLGVGDSHVVIRNDVVVVARDQLDVSVENGGETDEVIMSVGFNGHFNGLEVVIEDDAVAFLAEVDASVGGVDVHVGLANGIGQFHQSGFVVEEVAVDVCNSGFSGLDGGAGHACGKGGGEGHLVKAFVEGVGTVDTATDHVTILVGVGGEAVVVEDSQCGGFILHEIILAVVENEHHVAGDSAGHVGQLGGLEFGDVVVADAEGEGHFSDTTGDEAFATGDGLHGRGFGKGDGSSVHIGLGGGDATIGGVVDGGTVSGAGDGHLGGAFPNDAGRTADHGHRGGHAAARIAVVVVHVVVNGKKGDILGRVENVAFSVKDGGGSGFFNFAVGPADEFIAVHAGSFARNSSGQSHTSADFIFLE